MSLLSIPVTSSYHEISREKILWFPSSFFCPIKILVETDDGKSVLLCNRILVRIIEIQVEPVCCPGDLRKMFRRRDRTRMPLAMMSLSTNRMNSRDLCSAKVEKTDGMQREITDMQDSKIGTAEKIPDFLYPRAAQNIL